MPQKTRLFLFCALRVGTGLRELRVGWDTSASGYGTSMVRGAPLPEARALAVLRRAVDSLVAEAREGDDLERVRLLEELRARLQRR